MEWVMLYNKTIRETVMSAACWNRNTVVFAQGHRNDSHNNQSVLTECYYEFYTAETTEEFSAFIV